MSSIKVTATDRDSGDNGAVSYSLEGPQAPWASIDSSTGLITAAVSFDREQGEVVRFQVVARDRGDPVRSSSALVHVSVHDVNDMKPVFFPARLLALGLWEEPAPSGAPRWGPWQHAMTTTASMEKVME